jgi:aminoglycoside 3'-phosphotransferase-2
MRPASPAAFDLDRLDHARVLGEAAGRLGTRIQRLALPDGRHAYLKTAPHGGPEDLAVEHDRLRWLTGRLAVPEVLGFRVAGGVAQLLLSALPGVPAHQIEGAARDSTVRVIADALRRIHAIAVADCPFQWTTHDEIAGARALLAASRIDEPAFEAATSMSAADALAQVAHLEPIAAPQDTVWTHGDFCLPNVLVHDDRLGGILDWGLARVGDPRRDLALLEDSLRFNFGDAAVPAFYAIWGRRPAPDQLRFFNLLDQLSTYVRTEPPPGSAHACREASP